MDLAEVSTVFAAESEALGRALDGLPEGGWDRPTRCEPWPVRELLGHLCVVLDWVPGMVDAPAPPVPEVSATGYYRPDHRFDAATDAARIGLGRDRAAHHPSGPALLADFTRTWRTVAARCRDEPARRVVRTRHGDAMLLADFLLTRIVELAVHGLDLADALDREPWLTAPAGDAVLHLLAGPGARGAAAELGWSRADFLRRGTGRAPLAPDESARLARLGVNRLALG
ncbi:maleylpyruvate isomerase N-terminal domain-containing protein [Kitasatospora sp. NPDC088391]|uniref:maleylpyruvate isomerase N-terminal domain-containing protein n=1 Tax=Kitasatospora sp. NPDC088391 TaxID=3364074 RepID=UPI003820A725